MSDAELGTPKVAQIFAYGKCLIHNATYYTARSIWTNVLKCVILRKEMHLGV